MGIQGIHNLTGGPMENTGQDQQQDQPTEPQKDSSPAQPTDAAPDSASPATPAPDEAERASGQSDDNPQTDTDGQDESQGSSEDDAVVETDASEPDLTDNEPGSDEEVSPPGDIPNESFEADTSDTHGASDHPEA